jgi:PAS domain S-box-containing protein
MVNAQEAVLNILEDLQEAKDSLEISRASFHNIVAKSTDGIVVVNKSGIVEFVNPMAEAYLGYQAKELVGQSFSFPLKADQITEIDIIRHNKEHGTAEMRVVETRWNNEPARLALIRDITERKKMEEALLRANRKLNLISNITRHDLRNKLTATGTYLLLIPEVTDDPQVCELVERAEEGLDSITELFDFMKEYESLGDAAPEWVNIAECLRQVLQEINPGKVRIQVGDELSRLSVYADRMIKHVLFNLVQNALKHGGDGLSEVRFSYESKNDDLILICEDNGVGIAEKEKELIFSQGFHSRRIHGLFLIREILEITGLQITETGKPECGTRFEILLPAGTFRFVDTV